MRKTSLRIPLWKIKLDWNETSWLAAIWSSSHLWRVRIPSVKILKHQYPGKLIWFLLSCSLACKIWVEWFMANILNCFEIKAERQLLVREKIFAPRSHFSPQSNWIDLKKICLDFNNWLKKLRCFLALRKLSDKNGTCWIEKKNIFFETNLGSIRGKKAKIRKRYKNINNSKNDRNNNNNDYISNNDNNKQ